MGVQNFPELATGDVIGPASATNGNLAVFDGTTGKIIEDGGAVPDPAAILATTITNGDTTHAPDGNVVFDALYNNFRTQATAAGTTTLVAADKIIQEFTGTTTQTVTLPVVSTLTVGRQFLVINNSTGVVTVNSSGANLVQTLGPGTSVLLTCILVTGTSAASWDNINFNWTDASTTLTSTGRTVVSQSASGAFHFEAFRGTSQGYSTSFALQCSDQLMHIKAATGNAAHVQFSDYNGNFIGARIYTGDNPTGGKRFETLDDNNAVAYSVTTPGWPLSPGNSRIAGDVTNATDTMANLTGLSATLSAGRTYSGKLIVFINDSLAADGAKFDFNGGTATATNFRAHGTIFDTALLLSAQTSALDTDFVAAIVTGDAMVEIQFTITCNAAGTFIPRFAQNAHTTGTLTAYRGGYMILDNIP